MGGEIVNSMEYDNIFVNNNRENDEPFSEEEVDDINYNIKEALVKNNTDKIYILVYGPPKGAIGLVSGNNIFYF